MSRLLSFVVSLGVMLCAAPVLAKPTEAEKARKAAEKKLDAFEKNYDPSKDLSRKNPTKLEEDIAELDKLLEELKAVDAAGAAELATRRETLVTSAQSGVSTAAAGKADAEFTKRFDKLNDQFDPQKRRLVDVDPTTLKRAKDDLDRVIAKFDAAERKPYEDKRDTFFTKVNADIAAARVDKVRFEVNKDIPDNAAPGAERANPMAPTWCEGVDAALASTYSNYHVSSLRLSDDLAPAKALAAVVVFSCLDPSHDVRQKWVAWFRQGLQNTGLSSAQTEKLLQLARPLAMSGDANKAVEAELKDVCGGKYASLDSGPSEARFSRALERMALGCPGRLIDQANGVPLSSIDVPGGIGSQLAAASVAHALLTSGFSDNDGKLTAFAVANAALEFDASKFEQELSAAQLNATGVINATLSYYRWSQELKALQPEAKARNASVLLDAPKKGAAAFNAALASRKDTIDFALTLEDAVKAGTAKGCAEKLYPQLREAVKGTKDAFDDLRLDGLLAYELTLCARSDADAPTMDTVFGFYARRSTPIRGPFTSAYLAMVEAQNASGGGGGAKGDFDPAGRRGGPPSSGGAFRLSRNPIGSVAAESSNSMNPQTVPTGMVKAVEKKGALAHITFRTEHYMLPVLECVETNKIDRILDDGTILYRSSCKKVGEKPAEATNEPIAVPAWAAEGVGPGSFLLYVSAPVNDDVKGQPHRGWVVEAWDSPAKKKRTSLFGLAR